MKRYLKLLIPIFLFAIVISAAFAFTADAAPDSGYGVWSSEEAYLANPDTPEAYFTNPEISTAASKKYIVCYGNVTLNSQLEILNQWDVVINLNGNTLTTRSTIRVGSGSNYSPTKLTIKNGTLKQVSGQLFKAQNNARVYFENMQIILGKAEFSYSDGARLFYFKNSTIDLSACGTATVFTIYPILPGAVNSIASIDKVPVKDFNYVHNIVFDNSYVKNAGFTGKFINVPDGGLGRADSATHYEISFLPGSSFDVIDSHFFFLGNLNAGAYAKLHLSKGMKFKTKEVKLADDIDPILEVNLYNSVELDGMYPKLGDVTQIENEEGYEQLEGEIPKLIWGKSDDAEFPYMLCNYLYDVTWTVGGVEQTVTGYADGAKLDHKVPSLGYYLNPDDEKIYKDIHVGWATSPDEGAPYTEFITVTGNAKYYAVFEGEGPATIVEYSSPEMKIEDVVSIITSNGISASDFASFNNGSYVYFYEDASIDITTGIKLSKSLTLDLGGKALTHTGAVEDSVAVFNLTGSSLSIKNGSLNISMIGVASLDSASVLNLSDINVSYDSYPAFKVNGGRVNLTDTNVKGLSTSVKVPAFILAGEGDASVVFTGGSAVTCGALFTHAGSLQANAMNIDLTGVDITAMSVFSLYDTTLGAINPATKLDIEITDCNVDSSVVFSVPSDAIGTPVLDATFTVNSGTFTTSPDESECGKLIIPEGQSIVFVNNSFYTLLSANLDIKFNLALEYGFTAYFYVPTDFSVTDVSTYKDTFATSELSKTEIDGKEYYKIPVDGISPSAALEVITVNVGFTDADERACVAKVEYSPSDYFAKLLESSNVLEIKLSAAAMNYIASAYAYDEIALPEEFAELVASGAYLSNLRGAEEISAAHDSANIGNLGAAFTGAQLFLSDSLSIRFNIKAGFNGTLNVDGTEYVVTDGKVGELAYIECGLAPRSLYAKKIAVIGTSGELQIAGEYSLASYLASDSVSDDATLNMVSALYAYCYEAFVYGNKGVIPPFIDNSPAVDVTYR